MIKILIRSKVMASDVTLIPVQVQRIQKKIAADKLPFLHLIWPFFCQLHDYLSQN